MAKLGMSNKSKYKQQLLETKNLVGYGGKEETIRSMSSYETKAINYIQMLYNAGRIKCWSSEETIFQYSGLPWESSDKTHRYFMDFTIVMKDGTIVFIEVKPSSETQPPKKPRKSTPKSESNYQQQVKTYITNQAKWNTVKEFCRMENQKAGKIVYKFVIWDEKILGIKK